MSTELKIQGNIVKIMPIQQGESARGGWKKQDYIIETPGEYPKKICFTLWNDLIDKSNLQIGSTAEVFINIESREHNERWYTEIKAWKVLSESVAKKELPKEDEELPF